MPIPFFRALTGRHRTVSANERLGVSLAFVAGAINAGGFVAVHQYTSHMTGIVSQVADHVALGEWIIVLAGIGAVLMFIAGAMTSALLINWARRKQMHSEYALSLLLEGALLLLFGLMGAYLEHFSVFFLPDTVLLLCFIMGLQNAVATKISNARTRTTHVTGIVTDIGIELGKLVYWNRTPEKNLTHKVRANRAHLRLHVSLLLAFVAGGVLGALLFAAIGFRATLVLAAFLVTLAVVPLLDDLRKSTEYPLG